MEHQEPNAQEGDLSGSSLGMVLMKSLAEQLHGTLSLTHDGGTTLLLSFPSKSLDKSSA